MEWISVDDRLPEPGQLVIALYPQQYHLRKNAPNSGGSAEWGGCIRELVSRPPEWAKDWPPCRWADEGVTHWMPFTPPPGE